MKKLVGNAFALFGTELVVIGADLKNGNSHSCGCLKLEITKKRITTHNSSGTKIYHAWHKMNDRCDKPKSPSYKNYGARGIAVCDRWNRSNPQGFQNFLADMGMPSQGMTLNRIDNNGNYSPDNCAWATRKEQSRNTRRNVYLTFENETHCLADWAKITGISLSTIHSRVKMGWDVTRIIGVQTPPKPV